MHVDTAIALLKTTLLVVMAATIAPCASAGPSVELEPMGFVPVTISPPADGAKPTYIIPPGELERTPRDYIRVRVTARSEGGSEATLVIVDLLGREHPGETVELPANEPTQLAVAARNADGSAISLIRAIRLDVQGAPVQCTSVVFECAVEHLPNPDAVVQGPMDETAIQRALDALGPEGGVVYVPPGEYTINDTITVPADNISIYGAGKSTLLQGVHMDGTPMFKAEGRENIRFSRLHLRSLPLETFRGYNVKRYAAKPEDVGRPSLRSCGMQITRCRNVRVDHCEIERFGYGGVLIRDSAELCFDHCFFHENFCYGLGYGIVPCGTQECYIEDNNFENHRHGTAAGRGTNASYTARFNRFVKDTRAVPETGWKQVTSHEIDVHSGCKWLFAHDNWVEMKNGSMSAGAMLRGNSGWVWNNVFVNCGHGVLVVGASTDVWTWDNECHNVTHPNSSRATGQIHFDQKPPDFAPIVYPYKINTHDWWPGAGADHSYTKTDTGDWFAGPGESLQLRGVGDK